VGKGEKIRGTEARRLSGPEDASVSGGRWQPRVAGGGKMPHSKVNGSPDDWRRCMPEALIPVSGLPLSFPAVLFCHRSSPLSSTQPSVRQFSSPLSHQLSRSSLFTHLRPRLWVMPMSKRLPGLVIEVEGLPGFLAKSDEDILQHVRSVLLLRAYAAQRAQLAKCDSVQFSPTKDSCVFSAKGRALLHVRFAQLKA